jgi:hypothetical protein
MTSLHVEEPLQLLGTPRILYLTSLQLLGGFSSFVR